MRSGRTPSRQATPILNRPSAGWDGDLFSGSGITSLDSSLLGTCDVSWKARAETFGRLHANIDRCARQGRDALSRRDRGQHA